MPTAAENFEDRPVIVYSPDEWEPRHVLAIAQHFGKQTIVQSWNKGSDITDNAIHFSNDPALKRAISLTRVGRATAYVFKLDEIIDEVQTSALAIKHSASRITEVA